MLNHHLLGADQKIVKAHYDIFVKLDLYAQKQFVKNIKFIQYNFYVEHTIQEKNEISLAAQILYNHYHQQNQKKLKYDSIDPTQDKFNKFLYQLFEFLLDKDPFYVDFIKKQNSVIFSKTKLILEPLITKHEIDRNLSISININKPKI